VRQRGWCGQVGLLPNHGRSDGRAFRVLLLDASSKGVGTAQLGTGSSTCAQVLISTHASPGVLRFLEELVKVSTSMPSVRVSVIRTRGSTGAVKVRWTQTREPTRGGADVPQREAAHSGTLHFQGGERAKSFDIPIDCASPSLGSLAAPRLASSRLASHCAPLRTKRRFAARAHHQFRVSLSDAEGGALIGPTAATMLVMVVPSSASPLQTADPFPSKPVLSKARSPGRAPSGARNESGGPAQPLVHSPSQSGTPGTPV
jgi:hypothetical protein